MLKDRYNCPVTLSHPEILDDLNTFLYEFVSLGKGVVKIIEMLKHYPDEGLIHVYAAVYYIYGQTHLSYNSAKKHLKLALGWLQNATPRERSLYHGIKLWSKNHFTETLRHFETHCFHWPEDLPAIKMTEFLYYCKGQKFEASRFLHLTQVCQNKHSQDSIFLSIHSFAQELNGQYEESIKTAHQAMNILEHNPWAHHTLSHAYMNQGRINEGIQVFEKYFNSWSDSHRLIQSHNSWHLGLLYLENLDFDNAINIYSRASWDTQTHAVGEEIDAAALLWRLDMEGIDNTERWKLLAQSIEDHANFCCTPFITAQLCYALKRGKRQDALHHALKKIYAFTELQNKEDFAVWTEVGIPLILGSLAYIDQDYDLALKHFDPMIVNVGCVGGSDAQIDLFNQTYLKCLIGAKRMHDAKQFLEKLTHGRQYTALENKWLNEMR